MTLTPMQRLGLMSWHERKAAEDKLAALLAKDDTTMFCARELGFCDHTLIHDAVRGILAGYMARLLVSRGIFPEEAE